jgi:hypothetical protein
MSAHLYPCSQWLYATVLVGVSLVLIVHHRQLIDDKPTTAPASSSGTIRVFSSIELATFGPTRQRVYLAILGRVYDVTAGAEKFYRTGGYAGFAGRDGSAAFVTGDFTPTGLHDDVSGFTLTQIRELRHWVDFYIEHDRSNEYPFVGVLNGRYYDRHGEPTPTLVDVEARFALAASQDTALAAGIAAHPHCNSEYTPQAGATVSCDQGRVPRRLIDPGAGATEPRCGCVTLTEPASDAHTYAGCDTNSNRCANVLAA